MPRRLGLLGGMGPEATVLLMSRIIAATTAKDDHDHIPMIVDNNTQVPSRIAALIEGSGTDPGPVLREMARKLEDYGAEALIMPCNTAHTYAADIRTAVTIPFIDMVHETVAAITALDVKVCRLGVLASPATRMTRIFEQAFEPADVELVWPADEAATLATIRHIKAHGPDANALHQLNRAVASLRSGGIDAALIGCTEFSLLTEQLAVDVPRIDTLTVLVDRAVTFALAAE